MFPGLPGRADFALHAPNVRFGSQGTRCCQTDSGPIADFLKCAQMLSLQGPSLVSASWYSTHSNFSYPNGNSWVITLANN